MKTIRQFINNRIRSLRAEVRGRLNMTPWQADRALMLQIIERAVRDTSAEAKKDIEKMLREPQWGKLSDIPRLVK